MLFFPMKPSYRNAASQARDGEEERPHMLKYAVEIAHIKALRKTQETVEATFIDSSRQIGAQKVMLFVHCPNHIISASRQFDQIGMSLSHDLGEDQFWHHVSCWDS